MRFQLYTVKSEYLQYLSLFDNKIPLEHIESRKRPYIGILITYNNYKYVIPLSSPKKKHIQMHNTIDFEKIDDGMLGALNINNMILVCENVYNKKVIENEKDITYRTLLENQLDWINVSENKTKVINKVNRLLTGYKNRTLNRNVYKRCCDFLSLEIACKEWSYNHLTIKIDNRYQLKEFIEINKKTDFSTLVDISEYGKFTTVEGLDKNSYELQKIRIYARDEFGQIKYTEVIVKINGKVERKIVENTKLETVK